MLVTSDRHYEFDVAPDELWSRFHQTDQYQHWWPWLTRFESTGLGPQVRWACRVQPPVPYAVSFTLVLTEVIEAASISALVDGDIVGRAEIEITPTVRGCDVRLRAELAPSNPLLRAVALAARPIATYGHDWVLDTGFRQFSERALSPTGPHPRDLPVHRP